MNGFAKKSDYGFTLLEIIIVIVLLALVSALVIPRIRRQPIPASKKFEQQLNALLQQAKTNAIETRKLHRIIFDLKNNIIQIEVAQDKKDSQGKNVFEKLEIPYAKTSFPLDEKITVERFIVNGKNLLTPGFELKGIWFYITPEGMVQDVELGLYDQDDLKNFTITINPFFARATLV